MPEEPQLSATVPPMDSKDDLPPLDPELETILNAPPAREIPKRVANQAINRYGGIHLSPINILLIIIPLVSIFFLVFLFPWKLPIELLIRFGWSKSARATIVRVEDTDVRSGDNPPVSRVIARYVDPALTEVDLVNYYGDSHMIPGVDGKEGGDQKTDRSQITVRYLTSSPQYALLPNGRMSVFPSVAALVLIAPLFFFWLLWVRAKKRRRIHTLLAHGIVGEAEVVECNRTKLTVNGSLRYKAILRYGLPGNQILSGLSVYGNEGEYLLKCKMKGKRAAILYLREHPEKVMPLLLGAVHNGS